MCMYMYVCICIYIYIYIYTHVCIYTCSGVSAGRGRGDFAAEGPLRAGPPGILSNYSYRNVYLYFVASMYML